jgi:hypothetical protein
VNRRYKFQIQQLAAFQTEFRELLLPCLEQCSHGRWGLFGAYDSFEEAKFWCNWPESDRLRELAASIRSILVQSGERDGLCEAFLGLREIHGANDPGEPKLAQALLERIRCGEFGPFPAQSTSAAV